ncbi:MAG TPA: diaminopimelate decarboxylase, partial [Longimicrobiales bacterium]|nr:diaminopimelate decarboxylase [Longimicrobiales bacterium]
FAGTDTLVAYSVKANGNLALLHRLARLGAGADIVSAGELHRALRAGIRPERIVYAGVAKTAAEHRAALEAGILALNVESAGELRRLEEVARGLGVEAPFAIRVNPGIAADTPHEYTRTGHAHSKFGVPREEALELYQWAAARPYLRARGVDVHIGSQIRATAPYVRALDTVVGLAVELRDRGMEPGFVDLGGGFGVRYGREPGMEIAELARTLLPRLRGSGLRLVLEPGRAIVGAAGVLLTRVEYVKRYPHHCFIIVDGGMTELIRPSHYGGYHGIEPVVERPGAEEVVADIVGPICENGDFLARERTLALPEPGDVMAVRTAGAYGFTMASNYNARRRPAEAVVDRGEVHLVRARESVEDLLRGEIVPWEE